MLVQTFEITEKMIEKMCDLGIMEEDMYMYTHEEFKEYNSGQFNKGMFDNDPDMDQREIRGYYSQSADYVDLKYTMH